MRLLWCHPPLYNTTTSSSLCTTVYFPRKIQQVPGPYEKVNMSLPSPRPCSAVFFLAHILYDTVWIWKEEEEKYFPSRLRVKEKDQRRRRRRKEHFLALFPRFPINFLSWCVSLLPFLPRQSIPFAAAQRYIRKSRERGKEGGGRGGGTANKKQKNRDLP